MLHILLLLLKIIGFLILGILGLLLGLILLVLFVPVRYVLDGAYDGKLTGMVRVTWLLHMLSVMVSYEEESRTVVKVFGYRLFRKQENTDEDLAEEMTEALPVEASPADKPRESAFEKEMTDPMLEQRAAKPGKESTEKAKAHETPAKTKFFDHVYGKLKQMYDRWERIQEFLHRPENQETFRLVFRQTKALLCHLLPQKASGNVTFGFDDPYTTGQVLSAASIFYAWYGGSIALTPVFDDEVLEGNLQLKGRIRLGTILALGIRILMNKNARILIRRWRSKGGILDG